MEKLRSTCLKIHGRKQRKHVRRSMDKSKEHTSENRWTKLRKKAENQWTKGANIRKDIKSSREFRIDLKFDRIDVCDGMSFLEIIFSGITKRHHDNYHKSYGLLSSCRCELTILAFLRSYKIDLFL
ncbi:Hypothetical predicted protein [Octopus vulgaris]|uniref:Uncharacterized protein n=1 Tax=Octopus vulgaris TaxID=6645 RepID=A0AA36BKD2_OCTVU|nr:Hypothetical predicted protein [Octopus vulgaris]